MRVAIEMGGYVRQHTGSENKVKVRIMNAASRRLWLAGCGLVMGNGGSGAGVLVGGGAVTPAPPSPPRQPGSAWYA